MYQGASVGMKEQSSVSLGIILGVVFLSMTLGMLSVLMPWKFAIALALVPFFVLIAWNYPEVATGILVALLFGMIPDSILPKVSVGGGRLTAEDLGMLLFLLLLLLKNLSFHTNRFQPYVIPLISLLGIAFISSVVAFLYKTAPIKDVLTESRAYFTWIMLPILFLAIDNEARRERFKYIIFAIGILSALAVIIQSFTGFSLFSKGQEVRALWTMGSATASVLRSTTPAMFIMSAVLIYLLASYSLGQIKNGLFFMTSCLILTGGILVGFGRGLWLSVIVGFFLISLFTRGSGYNRLLTTFMVLTLILISSLMIFKPDYLMAISDRFTSITSEAEHGESFGRRTVENSYAISKVAESPILGVGLGGHYKPAGPESLFWESETRYIHNSYVNVLTKIGFPGLLAMLWLVLRMQKRAWHVFRHTSVEKPLALSAFWILITTTIFTSITQPNLVAPNGIISIIIAVFLVETISKKASHKSNLNYFNE